MKKKPSRKKSAASTFVGTVINIVILLAAVMLVYRGSAVAFDYGERIFGEEPMEQAPGTDVEVTVAAGDDVASVAAQLEEKGLIRDVNLFRIQNLITANPEGFREGTYALNTSMTPEEMINILSGNAQEE